MKLNITRIFRALRHPMRAAKRATMFGLSRLVYGGLGGMSFALSSSGVDVNTENSLQNSSYFRGVNLLSNAVGKTEFTVKSGADEMTAHPANKLVKFWAKHHQLSSGMFRKTLVVHALLYGNGYARIIRHNSKPVKLVILNPRYVTPELVNGDLFYRIDNPDDETTAARRLSASSIIHIKAFSVDGWVGLDPIRYWASETLGLAIAVQKYASQYYENGGQPRAYLHSEHPLSDEQWSNFEERIAPSFTSDLTNPHKMPLLEQMDIKSTGLNAEQTQLLESRKQSMLEIANILGIPPHKLGLTQSTAYNSLEEENKAFREDAVAPWVEQFESEYRKLLTEEEQESESHRIEANQFDLSKTDIKSRFEALNKATGGAAFMTPNDARKTMGAADHPEGDTLHKPPTNEVKDEPDGEAAADSDSGDDEADERAIAIRTLHQVRALTDVFGRITKRLAVEAVKRSAKSEQWPDYLEDLSDRHVLALRSMLEPIVPLCGGTAEDVKQITDEIVGQFRDQLAAVYDTETRDDFKPSVARAADRFQTQSTALALSVLHAIHTQKA